MNSSQEPTSIKLVVVGDGSVGKTCILLSYTTDKFPTEYVPTIFENYTSQVQVDEKMVNLSLWDTAGQETYNRLRTLSYGQADIFLIIFSVVDKASFENALQKWYPELNKDELKHVPKLFVGNKIDMRNHKDSDHILTDAATQLFAQQDCKYFECSALTQIGLKEVFDESIRLALKTRGRNNTEKPIKSQNQEKEEKPCCLIF